MKKRIVLLSLTLICILLLSACKCEHQWIEADCVTPKTCSECQETEGAPSGHSWIAATCEAPKICEVCALTEGEAKGHSWTEANCTKPKTCSVCHQTEGKELGHDWEEATTEKPKTCSVCNKTEGEKLDVDHRFTTASTRPIQGKWSADVTLTDTMLGLDGYFDTMDCTLYYEFSFDGFVYTGVEFHDRFQFLDVMKQVDIDNTYATFAAQGIGKSAANEAMEQQYGMTVEEFVDEMYDALDMHAILDLMEQFSTAGVYYVEDDTLYFGFEGWLGAFDESPFTIEDDTLIIELDTDENGEPFVWTRVED